MPLRVNIEMALRLKKSLKKFPVERKLCENILISSNIVLLHANDFLDQMLIEKGVFAPCFSDGLILDAIAETVTIIEMSIDNRLLSIQYNKKLLGQLSEIKFDKRRFQQVLLNILTNATKYQKRGQI